MSFAAPVGEGSSQPVRSPTPPILHRQEGWVRVPSSHLKRQILLPAGLVLLVLTVLFIVGAGQYLRGQEREHTRGVAQQVRSYWARLQQEEVGKLAWYVSEAQSDPRLAQAMARGDKDALLAATQNRFETLRQRFGVTHWYFMTPEGRVVLRVHVPGRSGDLITRDSLKQAMQSGEPVSGMELGALSTYTLRYVAPWRVDGKLIGYVEMGTEAQWFGQEISRVLNLQVMTAVRKSATSPERFSQGKASLGLSGRWGDDPDQVILSQTMAIVPDGLMHAWDRWISERHNVDRITELSQEDLRWSVAFVPLSDINGQQNVSMAVLRDVAAERQESAEQLQALALASLSMMGLLFATLYLRVSSAEGRLNRADEALRNNERRFSDFASATADWWFWELDANLCFSYVSPRLPEELGLSAEAMIGMPLRELSLNQDPVDRHNWAVYQDKLLQRQVITQFEFKVTLPSGEERWSSVSGAPVFDRGQFVGYRGTGCNISARRQAQADLALAATAFESQEGMMVLDKHSTVLRVNQAFTDISGYLPEDVVGRTTASLQPTGQEAHVYDAIRQEFLAQGRWQGEIWARRKNGEVYPQWLTITAVRSPSGDISHSVIAFSDISQRKAAEAEIERLAYFDSLTGLPNRRLLMDRLRLIQSACVRTGHNGALLLIDLDNFKTLNDTLGHEKGDLILRQITERLRPCLRASDTLARFGGDEFVVVLSELSTDEQEAAVQARHVADKLLSTLADVYDLDGEEYHSTCSIGVALFGPTHDVLDELMKRADLAMYEGKASGRNMVRFFDPAMQVEVTRRATLEADLRKALLRSEFELYYQPQVRDDGCLVGVEALVRWRHPDKGMVSPAQFIPVAENTGLILPLGQWVLEAACRQLAEWARNPATARLQLAVNVSARQFRQPDFADQVLKALSMAGARPERLKLELTESLLLDNLDDTIEKMAVLQSRGVTFALDDFGTGYSSLAYLKRLPLDQLKIDQSFVRNVLSEPNDAAIVPSIIGLAQSLGLTVIAEGVETEAQRHFLAEHGCAHHQGYLFGRPMPVGELERAYVA